MSRQAIPIPPVDDADAKETRAPCAEGMLAATLALMTGFAEHCAHPEIASAKPAVPRLLAAKAASNLFFLAGNPALSEPMRATLWRLRAHWEALEQGRTPEAPEVRACAVAPQPHCRPPASNTRH
jgi:hypothetical protein